MKFHRPIGLHEFERFLNKGFSEPDGSVNMRIKQTGWFAILMM